MFCDAEGIAVVKPRALKTRVLEALELAPMTAYQLSRALCAHERSVRSVLQKIGAVAVGFHKTPGRIAVFIYSLP